MLVGENTVSGENKPSWKIKLLYDGECPLCVREVNFLRQRDQGRGLVAFVDIAEPDYNPSAHGGIDFATAMGRIHALLADGTVVKNVEVFRRVYQVLGLGWVYAATAWPIIGPIVDGLYGIWADRRLALTGRPSLQTLLSQRQQSQAAAPDGQACALEQRCR
jgi:predicted DCC family thiol-disulfide oxidoreductase YuxK